MPGVTETYRPLVHEIFTKINNAKDKPKKMQVLRQYKSEGMEKLLKAAFDPQIKWLLPEGDVPFKPNDAPEGTEHTRLEHEARTLKNYVALENAGQTHVGNPDLNNMKRELLFIQLLEGLCEGEARVLILAKDKKLNKYKGLTAAMVREAYGWDENFMTPGVTRVAS